MSSKIEIKSQRLLDKIDKDYVSQSIQNAEKELLDKNIEDQKRFLISQKIDVLKSISSN